MVNVYQRDTSADFHIVFFALQKFEIADVPGSARLHSPDLSGCSGHGDMTTKDLGIWVKNRWLTGYEIGNHESTWWNRDIEILMAHIEYFIRFHGIPSGKHTKKDGKSQLLIGNSL